MPQSEQITLSSALSTILSSRLFRFFAHLFGSRPAKHFHLSATITYHNLVVVELSTILLGLQQALNFTIKELTDGELKPELSKQDREMLRLSKISLIISDFRKGSLVLELIIVGVGFSLLSALQIYLKKYIEKTAELQAEKDFNKKPPRTKEGRIVESSQPLEDIDRLVLSKATSIESITIELPDGSRKTTNKLTQKVTYKPSPWPVE